MTVTLKCELFIGLLTRQKIIRSQCRLRCPCRFTPPGCTNSMPPVLMIVKFAVPPDNLARPRTLSEQAPFAQKFGEKSRPKRKKLGGP